MILDGLACSILESGAVQLIVVVINIITIVVFIIIIIDNNLNK